MMQVGIIGATGYTGSELVRILLRHPDVEIAAITSESKAGSRFSDIHPQFDGLCDIELIKLERIDDFALDVVFLALPHGISMNFVANNQNKNYKIIDLSGDFRLSTPDVYKEWYKKDHVYPDGFRKAVFGLPEIYREQIKGSRLIANPGCYPTASILATAPLVKYGLVDTSNIIIDAKSGITGAGVKASETTHFANVNDNFKAYGVTTHRHSIEILEQLGYLSESDVSLLFTPHLLPIDRGILSTVYLKPKTGLTQESIDKAYANMYDNDLFIRYRGSPPSVKQVRGSNFCDVFAKLDPRTNTIIAMGVIDNLIKGAAGQAVQNMNIAFGIEENIGLKTNPLQP